MLEKGVVEQDNKDKADSEGELDSLYGGAIGCAEDEEDFVGFAAPEEIERVVIEGSSSKIYCPQIVMMYFKYMDIILV